MINYEMTRRYYEWNNAISYFDLEIRDTLGTDTDLKSLSASHGYRQPAWFGGYQTKYIHVDIAVEFQEAVNTFEVFCFLKIKSPRNPIGNIREVREKFHVKDIDEVSVSNFLHEVIEPKICNYIKTLEDAVAAIDEL